MAVAWERVGEIRLRLPSWKVLRFPPWEASPTTQRRSKVILIPVSLNTFADHVLRSEIGVSLTHPFTTDPSIITKEPFLRVERDMILASNRVMAAIRNKKHNVGCPLHVSSSVSTPLQTYIAVITDHFLLSRDRFKLWKNAKKGMLRAAEFSKKEWQFEWRQF